MTNNNGSENIFFEVQSVKRLLVLQLLAIGYKQKHLAAALGVSEASLSRMLPKGLSKVAPKIGSVAGIAE